MNSFFAEVTRVSFSMRLWSAGLSLLVLTACDEGKRGEDTGTDSTAEDSSSTTTTTTTTSTTATTTSSAATTGGSSDSSVDSDESGEAGDTGTSSSTSGDTGSCADYPAHSCGRTVECSGHSCGPTKRFTSEGCLRSDCDTDGDCQADEVCYRPADFGGCASSYVSCGDAADGSCECESTDDCGGAYCIAREDFPPKGCEGFPAHTCSSTVDCDAYDCGPLAPFTAGGCLRESCDSDEDCGDGLSCYRAADWGGCASSQFDCSDEDDLSCGCGGTDDCGGAYCVDEGSVHSICGQHANEAGCKAANANLGDERQCLWLETSQVDTKGMTCEATPREGLCVAGVVFGDGCSMNSNCPGNQLVYTKPESDIVLYNLAGCGAEPLGWTQCLEGSKEAACNCACPE